jgi:IS605 OrfB family transposase
MSFPIEQGERKEISSHSWFSIAEYDKGTSTNSQHSSSSQSVVTATLRARKVRLYPTLEQRKSLREWFKIGRYYYNLGVKWIHNNVDKDRKIPSEIDFRTIIRGLGREYLNTRAKNASMPAHVISDAIRDAHKAYKSATALMKSGKAKKSREKPIICTATIKSTKVQCTAKASYQKDKKPVCGRHAGKEKRPLVSSRPSPQRTFRLRYKKRGLRETLSLPYDKDVSDGSYFARSIFWKVIVPEEGFDYSTIKHDCRLQHNTLSGHYYLFVPQDKSHSKSNGKRTVSLDPGGRKFQTGYIEDGGFLEINGIDHLNKTIERTIKPLESFDSNAKAYRYRRKWHKKLGDLIDDLHWKTANYLCSKFERIVIGKFSTISILSNSKNLPPVVKRKMQALSHFTFRQRLKSKGEEYGVEVIEQNEAYTTMTCGKCDARNKNVGSSEVYTCPVCKFTLDRDWNASRNIFRRWKGVF